MIYDMLKKIMYGQAAQAGTPARPEMYEGYGDVIPAQPAQPGTAATKGLLGSGGEFGTGGVLQDPRFQRGLMITAAGLRGQSPLDVMTTLAKIQKLTTPTSTTVKAAFDPKTGKPVYATPNQILAQGLQPIQQGQVIESIPGGGFRIIPAAMATREGKKQDTANALKNANAQFNLVGNRIIELTKQKTPTGTVGTVVSAIEGISDQVKQGAEQLGIIQGYKVSDDKLINSKIKNITGLTESAKNFARVKSQLINLAYIMARQKEPDNPRLSDADITRQMDRLAVGGSREKLLAAIQEVLTTENTDANRRYKSLTGQDLFEAPPLKNQEGQQQRPRQKDPLNLF